MQAVVAGSLDTQAAGSLAGTAGLAAIDIALDRWTVPLVLAVVSAAFSIQTILGASLRGIGPSPSEILDGRAFIAADGNRVILSDMETEWVILSDIEETIDQNAHRLAGKAEAVFRATTTLSLGLASLVLLQASG